MYKRQAPESPYTTLRPFSFTRCQVTQYFHTQWAAEWDSYVGGRMTKEFLPCPNSSRVGPLLDLDRTTLTQCLSFLTGHNNLRYHYSLRESGVSPECRFCSLAPETSSHLYATCPRFSTLRFDINGLFHIPFLPPVWTVDRVVTFLQNHHISLAMDNTPEFPPPNEHDWSDIDPDPPDSASTDSSVNLSLPSSVF